MSPLKRDALTLLLLLAPVLAVVWPVLGDPGGTVLGGSFVYGHLWSWELVASQGIQLTTQVINYPEGGAVTLIGWSFLLPVLALRALGLGVVAAANLVLGLHLLAGAYLAYRLALRLTHGSYAASVVGGAAYGFCPLVLSLVWNGQYPKLVHGLLPLALLMLVRLADGRRWPMLALGPTLALLLASSPYLGIFGAALALMGGAWILASRRRAIPLKDAALRLGLAGLLALVAAAPFFWYWSAGASGQQLLAPAGTGMDVTAMADFRASLAGWFDPRLAADPSAEPHVWDVHHVHYIGWVGLALAALALVVAWRRRGRQDPAPGAPSCLGTGFFVTAGVVFFVLAHGSHLDLGSTRLPLPMQWLWDAVPASRALYATYRAAVVVSLVVAMLGTLGLAWLTVRLGRRLGAVLCAAAGLLVLGEALLVSPAPFPIKVAAAPALEVYADLARRPGCGAVLVVPYGVHDESLAMDLHRFHQIQHRHPLAHGVLKTPRRRMAAFHDRLYRAITGHDPPPLRRARPGQPRLHFRYVLLHERLIKDRQRLPGVRAFLDRAARLVKAYPDQGVRLYETIPAGQGAAYPRAPGLPGGRCL